MNGYGICTAYIWMNSIFMQREYMNGGGFFQTPAAPHVFLTDLFFICVGLY